MSEIERLEKAMERSEIQMVAMAQGMKDLSVTMQEIATNQAVNDERMLRVIEDNQRRDIRIDKLERKTAQMDRISGLNTYARDLAPKIFFSLLAAFSAGGTVIYTALTIMGIVK
jgi:uncharacterized membrane protein